MDKSIIMVPDKNTEPGNQDFLKMLGDYFPMQDWKPDSYSGLPLAFIGDGIYELVIRSLIMNKGNTQVKKIHNRRAELVNAGTQSRMIQALYDQLTEEEQGICRRGRNTKPHTKARNASVEEYMWATGMEALCGWLFLQGRMDRLLGLVAEGLKGIGYDLGEITGAR